MKHRALLLVCVTLVGLLSLGFLFWRFEHGVNPSVREPFDVVWWWVVTSATVGYGDIVPVTWQGRIAAMLVILIGLFIYASFVALVVESVHMFIERRKRGTAQVRARGQVVVCEYTAIADELIRSLPQSPALAGLPVVIVTELVQENPYPEHSFVCGVPINPSVLKRANIEHADWIFIFANMRFVDPDIKTIHVAARVMEHNEKARVFVELVGKDSSLVSLLPRPAVTMDSRRLLETVLKGEPLDPGSW